jgi:hypothetical protein
VIPLISEILGLVPFIPHVVYTNCITDTARCGEAPVPHIWKLLACPVIPRLGDFSLMWIRRTGTFRSTDPKRHHLSLCDRVLQQRRKQRHGCDEPTEGFVLQQTSASCQALCFTGNRRRCKTYPL